MTIDPMPLAVLMLSAALAGALLAGVILGRRRAGRAAAAAPHRDAFFAHVPVAMTIHAPGGRLLFASDAVAALYGCPLAELYAAAPDELADCWTDIAALRAAGCAVGASGQAQQVRSRFRPPGGGAVRIFDVTLFAIPAEAGAAPRIGSVAIDVTAATLAREEAEMTRQQLEAFFEHAPVGLAIHDTEGRYLYASSVTQQVYGMTDAELKNRTMQSISHLWPDAEEIEQVMAEVAQGQVRRLIKPLYSPNDAEPFYFDVIMFPISNAGGEIVQIGALGSDITPMMRTESALAAREAQLRSLFEHVPAQILVFDSDHRVVMANQLAADLHLTDPASIVGKLPPELSDPWDDFAVFYRTGVEVLESGVASRFQPVYRDPETGAASVWDAMFFPIRGADGSVEQVGLFLFDITEKAHAESELRQSRAMVDAFFDNLPGFAFLSSADDTVVAANSYLADTFALAAMAPDRIIGRKGDTLLPDGWQEIGNEARATNAARGDAYVFEAEIPTPKGPRHIVGTRFPVRDGEGRDLGIGGLIFDRSAEKFASEQVGLAREALHQSEKLAALGQLLAGVAHELNNPLTVVVGRSAILAEKLSDTPYAKALADIREAADRCGRIVKTFLAMARQSAPRRGAVQVNDTIEAALDMVAYNLRSGGVELVRRYDPDLPEVDADEDQLVQVFTNLMVNAGHALESAEGVRRLTLSTSAAGGRVVAAFADSGPGVPAELVARIFEPFFTTKAVGEGTGMGLAMARGMIEELGGTLDYADGEDGGAVFRVTLPQVAAPALAEAARAAGEPLGAPADNAAAAAADADAAAAGARVLIVDDEPAIRTMLAEILRRVGIDSAEAGDGADAARMLAAEQFDLIVCDVRMPVMDGVRLRQHLADTRPDLLERLIFMSGDVLQRSGERYAPLAAHAIIDKPFRPSEARAVVLAALAKLGSRSTPA